MTATACAAMTLSIHGCGQADYGDRIDELENRVENLEAAVESLEEAMEAGAMIEDIVPIPGGLGYRIVFTGDREPIEILHGNDGVTPMIEVRHNGEGFSVWYNTTPGYPDEGWVDTGVTIDGDDAVTPRIRVVESGGKLVIEYNVTEGYPDDGWESTGTDIGALAGENPIEAIVDNADGTVTFVVNSFGSPEYTFAKFSTAQHFEIMTVGGLQFEGSEELTVVFRVNPSTAFVPTGGGTAIARWTLDQVGTRPLDQGDTRASYLNPSDVFSIRSIRPDGYPDNSKAGQYVAAIASNHLSHDEAIEEYFVALVLDNNAGETGDQALVSSGPIGMKVSVPQEELPLASGVIGATDNISWTLTYDGTMTLAGSGEMPDYPGYPLTSNPWNGHREAIGRVVVSEGITGVGANTFNNCPNLTEVVLPASVTRIGGSAFTYCSSLESIAIPGSVKTIGDYAFSDCSALQTLALPDGLETIGNQAFTRSGLIAVVVPDSVTSVGTSAFTQSASLTSITLGAGLSAIGNYTFEKCTALTSVTIPGNIKSIGNNAFDGCALLSDVSIAEGVETIGNYAFRYCYAYADISLPASLRSIGNYAFYYCPVEELAIPNGVTSIGSNAFQSCASLTTLTIGDGVETIGNSSFYDCAALVSVTIRALSPPQLGNANFATATGDTLYVPAEVLSTYSEMDVWATVFSAIDPIP
jgi:hypothetical protein